MLLVLSYERHKFVPIWVETELVKETIYVEKKGGH